MLENELRAQAPIMDHFRFSFLFTTNTTQKKSFNCVRLGCIFWDWPNPLWPGSKPRNSDLGASSLDNSELSGGEREKQSDVQQGHYDSPTLFLVLPQPWDSCEATLEDRSSKAKMQQIRVIWARILFTAKHNKCKTTSQLLLVLTMWASLQRGIKLLYVSEGIMQLQNALGRLVVLVTIMYPVLVHLNC